MIETNLVPTSDLEGILTRPEYQPMLSVVSELRPAVQKAIAHHGKTHTQFQYAMLDNAGPIAGPTPLRNMRQVLATIERTEGAIEESFYARRKDQLRAEMCREKAEGLDGAEAELMELKAEQHESGIRRTDTAIQGAIRKLTAYYEQYRSLEKACRKELGLTEDEEITERHFEEDEERFHIKKVFEQALIAVRASGRVDHGNMIYFNDLGICGEAGQNDVIEHAARIRKVLADGLVDRHDAFAMDQKFLENMVKEYRSCSARYARLKGLIPGALPTATLGYLEDK